MERLLYLWNVSVFCGIGILLVFAVSLLLCKTHTVFWRYCLWLLLAVRLALPFDISVPGRAVEIPFLSGGGAEAYFLPGAAKEVSDEAGGKEKDAQKSVDLQRKAHTDDAPRKAERGKTADGGAKNVTDIGSGEENGGNRWETTPRQAFSWAAFVWAAGAAASLLWQIISYAHFYRKTEKTKRYVTSVENIPVYISSAVGAPVLMGLKSPRILLADRKYEEKQLDFILAHELAHYHRKDLWAKMLFAAARTLHWFNPLVYRMERQAVKDMELLCDSRVVRNFSRDEKKQYGKTLLDCASSSKNRRAFFGTSDFSRDVKTLKERFANLFSANTKKNGIFAAVLGASVLLSASLFVACAGSVENAEEPKQKTEGNHPETTAFNRTETENQAQDGARLNKMRSKLTGLNTEDAAGAVYGTVFPKLLYASDERAILYDYWGLMVYDLKNGRIGQLIDLKSADLCHIQGEWATHIEVSKDGGTILLYNEPDAGEQFLYDVDKRQLDYSDLKSLGEERYDALLERGDRTFAKTPSGKIVYLSADSLFTKDGGIFHPDDMQGLSIIAADGAWGGAQIYPLFSEYYEKKGEEAVPYLKMEDLGRILEKEFLHEDEEGWRYYLEEDLERESPIWEFAEQVGPLLLTRYRNEERQVLENLLFEDAWRECPVLFAGGRILYKAAVTPDITGIKEATLISIAMDGSGRRAADTIMYRVFDGVCEDGGWIYYSGWTNDSLQPKPLCRISPDFSGGAQFVEEIPGLLCGVKDGFVYYLASHEKDYTGIWKRNLSTGEEQIFDKWGLAAEELVFFWARENIFAPGELRVGETSGCSILYMTDDEDKYFVSHVPFD